MEYIGQRAFSKDLGSVATPQGSTSHWCASPVGDEVIVRRAEGKYVVVTSEVGVTSPVAPSTSAMSRMAGGAMRESRPVVSVS